MPLVKPTEIFHHARNNGYGVFSVICGSMEMISGPLRAAEEHRSPFLFVFSQGLLTGVSKRMAVSTAVRAAGEAAVPVGVAVLEKGPGLEAVREDLDLGASCVMYDAADLPIEENVRLTKEASILAHSTGADLEAKLGNDSSGRPAMDPLEFVKETGADALAISFGNAVGPDKTGLGFDYERIRQIRKQTGIPLVMHGGSGLDKGEYRELVRAGISWFCCYSAIAKTAAGHVKDFLEKDVSGSILYHQIIDVVSDYYYESTETMISNLECAGRTGYDS